MEFDLIISSFGECDEIELTVTVYTEIVFSAKMYFCPAFPCSHFVSFDDRQIDHSFLISHISGPFDEHISFDIA
jgi:hypothetical protein